MTGRRGVLLCAFLAGALLPWLPTGQGAEALAEAVEAAGGWLRQLSLSGAGGNLLAWAIALLLSALPLLLLVLPQGEGDAPLGGRPAAPGGPDAVCPDLRGGQPRMDDLAPFLTAGRWQLWGPPWGRRWRPG